jgi:peptide chain release factor subunit 1
MISHEDIERLANLKSEQGILSAYIRIDPRLRYLRQQAASQFKGALKEAARRLQQSRWKEALDRESEYMLNFLSSWEPSGQGLVVFSCRPENLWEVVSLEVLVPNRVDVDATTQTGILAQTLGEFPRFVVVVLQRDKAQIFIAEQGTADYQFEVASEVPGQHNQGGRAQMRFQRHIEFHVAEHLKNVTDQLKKLAEGQPFQLAIGGTEQTATQLFNMLPEPVARRVIGRFPVDYKHDNEQEILQRAYQLWKAHERAEQSKLVDRVFDAAKSSSRQGVLGAPSTVDALIAEKVQTLLLVDGLAIDGAVCTQCDYFATQRFSTCPLCGGDAEQRDITDRTVEKAISTGAEVEVVGGEARARMLVEGGVGALLRY